MTEPIFGHERSPTLADSQDGNVFVWSTNNWRQGAWEAKSYRDVEDWDLWIHAYPPVTRELSLKAWRLEETATSGHNLVRDRRPTPEEIRDRYVFVWRCSNSSWEYEHASVLGDRDFWFPIPPPPTEEQLATRKKLVDAFEEKRFRAMQGALTSLRLYNRGRPGAGWFDGEGHE